jgi:hypothetical protein
MKAKSNKESKGSKHRPAVKDIPPKGNPLGGMGTVGGRGSAISRPPDP